MNLKEKIMVYLTIFKVLLAKWQINLSSTNISPLNRFDSTGIIKNRESPNLFPENVGKSPNLCRKTLLKYIIYRNVTFCYDIEQLT